MGDLAGTSCAEAVGGLGMGLEGDKGCLSVLRGDLALPRPHQAPSLAVFHQPPCRPGREQPRLEPDRWGSCVPILPAVHV